MRADVPVGFRFQQGFQIPYLKINVTVYQAIEGMFVLMGETHVLHSPSWFVKVAGSILFLIPALVLMFGKYPWREQEADSAGVWIRRIIVYQLSVKQRWYV